MIIINNIKFAKNNKEFNESLLTPGGTCYGYYKANKKSIILKDAQKKDFGFINIFGLIGSRYKVDGSNWHNTKTPEVFSCATLSKLSLDAFRCLKQLNLY